MRYPDFNEETAAAIVIERLQHAGNVQLAKPLARVVDHIHATIRETRPSRQDWREVISFLTAVGYASDERRQEWVFHGSSDVASNMVLELRCL